MSNARALRPLLALVAVSGAADGALLPLLPTLRGELGLSGLEVAMLLSATTVAMLLGALPAGLLAGRVGSGRLLAVVAALLPVSLGAMALAPTFEALLAARALFGLSFCLLWVVAPAWVASAHGTAGMGRVLAASGAGWLAGPLVAGVVADLAGWRAGLVVVGLAGLPVLPGIVGLRGRTGERAPTRLGPALRTLRDVRAVRLVVATSAVLGVVTGVSGLLPAYVLAENGLSAGAIGVAMGLAAGVWIVAARAAGRLDSAGPTVVLGWALAGLASIWLLPVASLSTAAVLGFLLVSAACRSTLNTLVYAVGARAVGEVAAPAVVGMMNLGWAIAALVAPFVAGAAESDTGVRGVFAATAALAGCVALATLRPSRQAAAVTA